MLEMAALIPHPPIVIPEVGGVEAIPAGETKKAMEIVAKEIAGLNPELLVVITPHGPVFSDAITLTAVDPLVGNLSAFGAPEVLFQEALDRLAVKAILHECQTAPFVCAGLTQEVLKEYGRTSQLDHGITVPLYFIKEAGWKGKLVPVNMGFLNYEALYHFGALMAQALNQLKRKWVLVISGDMSHHLSPQGVHGYSPQGAVFDEIIRQALREGDIKRLFSLDPDLVEAAGECSLRPIIMGLGAFDGLMLEGRELSYQGPFGVGYLVAIMTPGEKMPQRKMVTALYDERAHRLSVKQQKETPPVRLARQVLAHYFKEGEHVMPSMQDIDDFQKRAGCFVSLKKDGQLRGCIGTIQPTQDNLAEEIIHNALQAAFHDPRFEPLDEEELETVTISVDVLDEPEKISSIEQLDPQIFGVIVSRGRRRGLLLPDLPGVTSAQEQVRIAKEKAGLRPEDEVSLARFRVTRYA